MKFFLIFSLLLLFCAKTFSQNPGNVTGCKLWLKAEKPKDSFLQKKVMPQNLAASYFNFNPVINRESFSKTFKNIVSEQYSLFLVFKSDFEDERIIMTLNRGKTSAIITSKELLNNKEMPFKIDVKKGMILGYLNGNNDKNGKKRNSLMIDELFAKDEEGREQLMELIYYPRLLSKQEREKVETYLSIKYGISIADDFDYLDSKGDKVWDVKENSVYGNRVTGIGRDDAYRLNQKQSGNYLKDGIYIGLGTIDTTNAQNNYTIKDKSFLLWGDNSGKTLFLNDETNRLKRMKRLWKMDLTGITPSDSITTQLKINKKEFAYSNRTPDADFLWLCVNQSDNGQFNYTDAKYIKQSSEDDNFIYFDAISWDTDGSGADIFTFIQGPDFFMEHKEDFACETGSGLISVKLMGGTLPYTLNFDGKEFTTSNDTFQFSDVESGTYTLNAAEAKGGSISTDITLSAFSDTSVTLLPLWHLNAQGEATITPTINHTVPTNLSFEWVGNGKTVASGKEFTTKFPGDYTLTITSAEGCKQNIPFKVEGPSNSMRSGWNVYPNPTRSGEPFSIAFNLERESEVLVKINSIEGKQVLHKNLGIINDFIFQETIVTSGVYLITIQIGSKSETVKLIIR